MKIAHAVRTIALPLLLVGLFACNNDEEFTTHVSGKVVNRFSKEPIADAYVFLNDGMSSSGLGAGWQTSSDKRVEGRSDINGEFMLELTGEYEATLGVFKEGYAFDPDWDDEIGEDTKGYGYGGDYENQVLEMEAEAGFNPLFESTVPILPTDSLVIFIGGNVRPAVPANQLKDWLNTGWTRLYVGQQISRFSPVDNVRKPEEFGYPATGDTYTPYQIAYTRNGQWESRIDSIYIKSLETYTETIYY